MNISTLEAYVNQKNEWSLMFNENAVPLSLMNAEDRQEIADYIDNELSPENLTCDGELSRSQVNAKYRRLTRCAQELLSIDPNVTFYEYS